METKTRIPRSAQLCQLRVEGLKGKGKFIMTWDIKKTKKIETELSEALKRFKWSEAEKICGELITDISQSDEFYPEDSARGLLSKLRNKQCYDLMSSLAEAFIRSGANYLQIRR